MTNKLHLQSHQRSHPLPILINSAVSACGRRRVHTERKIA